MWFCEIGIIGMKKKWEIVESRRGVCTRSEGIWHLANKWGKVSKDIKD